MKKKLLKQIRQVANELPEMTYTAFPKEYVYPEDKEGRIDKKKPKVLRSNRVQVRVNHTRRLKKLVEKMGFEQGVKQYFKSLNIQR